MTPKKHSFIIVDDNVLDCFIVEKKIQMTGTADHIFSYSDPKEAFNVIEDSKDKTDLNKTVIILDIHMPLMNGFEFVEEFEKLPKSIQDKYTIWALTTSMNIKYINRISSYKSVKHLLRKPLKTDSLTALINAL